MQEEEENEIPEGMYLNEDGELEYYEEEVRSEAAS